MGELGGMNLYGFVYNGPGSFFDYLGLDPQSYGAWGTPDAWNSTVNSDGSNKPDPTPNPKPKGFSICQRDIEKNGDCGDCVISFANSLGGEHSYFQHINEDEDIWGWANGPTKPEQKFNPNDCITCKKKDSGSTDEQIKNCIMNKEPSKPYDKFGYNCLSWAKEAAEACGLDCE